MNSFDRSNNIGYGGLALGERDEQLAAQLRSTVETIGISGALELVAADHLPVLRLLAERLASLSVTRGEPPLLAMALVALLLSGVTEGSRESLVVLAVVGRAAQLLNVELEDSLHGVAPDSTAWVAEVRRLRPRSIEEMGYGESTASGEFRFQRQW